MALKEKKRKEKATFVENKHFCSPFISLKDKIIKPQFDMFMKEYDIPSKYVMRWNRDLITMPTSL